MFPPNDDEIKTTNKSTLFPIPGTLYIVGSKYGYTYFYKGITAPYDLLSVENGTILLFLQEITTRRNSPFDSVILYQFLLGDRNLYLFNLNELHEVLV